MTRVIAYFSGVVLVVGLAATAAAQDARGLFQRGQGAYDQGDYEGAIRDWNAAFQLEPRPLIQYNLSQAYERLGRLDEARVALETYIAQADPNDPNQSDGRARLAAIRERLNRTGLQVAGGAEGATLLVDGTDRGRLPRPDPIGLSPGTHQIEARREGFETFRATVVVPAGQLVNVQIEMAEAAGGGGGGGGGGDGGGDTGGDGPGIAPIILIAGGGAVAITGFILGAMALGQANDLPTRDHPDADGARTLALVADICIFGGLAAAGVGAVLLVLGGGSSTEQAPESGAMTFSPFISPRAAGASASLSF